MNVKIVDSVRKFKFTVFPSVEGRFSIFRGDVQVLPVIKWFNSMHGQIYY